MRVALSFASLLIATMPAFAEACTDYEAEVFRLADEAVEFQQTDRFKEYGFGSGGPFAGWINRMRSLQSHPEADAFDRRYDFNVTSVYSVADEYRTAGKLDDFYREVESRIQNAKRCEYTEGRSEDDDLQTAYLVWAGMNCGNAIPMDEYGQALQDFNALGEDRVKAYRAEIKSVVSKLPSTKAACGVVLEALGR